MPLANFSSVSKIYEAANANLKQVFAQLTPAIPTMPADAVNTSIVQAYAYLKELRDMALQQHPGDVIIDDQNILHDILQEVHHGPCSVGVWPSDLVVQAELVKHNAGDISKGAIMATHHNATTAEMKEAANATAAMCIKLIMNLPK